MSTIDKTKGATPVPTTAPVVTQAPPAAPKLKPLALPFAPQCVATKEAQLPTPVFKLCDTKVSKQVTLKGPLFYGSAKYSQVGQGSVGDCYFCSSVAAIAKTNPQALKDMIHDNLDGTYTVMFKQKNALGVWTPVPVVVDGKVWANPASKDPHFGADPGGACIWFAILEKAYVKFRGGASYSNVSGGYGAQGFSAVLGVGTTTVTLSASPAMQKLQGAQVGSKIEAAWAKNKPMVFNTSAHPSTKGVVDGHSYHVIDVRKGPNGEVQVKLRNPWDQNGEPVDSKGNAADGANDGTFWVSASSLGSDFDSIEIAD